MLRGLACWIANRLPLEVVYFAVLRAWLDVTFGNWPDAEWELRAVFGLDDETS